MRGEESATPPSRQITQKVTSRYLLGCAQPPRGELPRNGESTLLTARLGADRERLTALAQIAVSRTRCRERLPASGFLPSTIVSRLAEQLKHRLRLRVGLSQHRRVRLYKNRVLDEIDDFASHVNVSDTALGRGEILRRNSDSLLCDFESILIRTQICSLPVHCG